MTKLLNNHPPDDLDVKIAGPVARKLLAVGMDSVDVFFLALVAGDIVPGAFLANALSRDVFQLYKSWCLCLEQRPMPMPRFVSALQRRHKVRQTRARYQLNGERHGPHGVLLLGGTVEPIDAQIARFKAGVRAYEGGGHA